MYKAIFCDLDGTLINDFEEIVSENKEAIQKAKAKGIKFVICSGRIKGGFDRYNADIDIEDAIAANGTIVYSNNRITNIDYVDKQDLIKVIEYADKNNYYVRFFTEDSLYCLNAELEKRVISHNYRNTSSVTKEEAYKLASENVVVKLGFFNDHEVLEKIRKELSEILEHLELVFSGDKYLDVVIKGNNKGEGIKKFCKANNIDIKDTIGIGDEENDFPMLKTVGFACCPKNARESVKKICDYIASKDNNNGAVAEIIKNICLK